MKPVHVAIIMDGNGRWAQKRGLPRVEGHRRGALKVEKVVEWAAQEGIKYLSLYAFSTENWKRPKEEVGFLFSLFANMLSKKLDRIMEQGVRLRFSGRLDKLPEQIYQLCLDCEEKTKNNMTIQVIIALNYGGRAELIDAFNKAIKHGVKELDESTLRSFLYIPDVPDPDLVIRTSGEERLSNFLIWQTAYSELYFTKVLWPDFSREDFKKALENYEKRERKFGGLVCPKQEQD